MHATTLFNYDSFVGTMRRNMPAVNSNYERKKAEEPEDLIQLESSDDDNDNDVSSEMENCGLVETNDKCPVCLVPEIGLKNRAYASNCMHKFCFECLLEWSKIRSACPVCKTPFDRILYDCPAPAFIAPGDSPVDFKEFYLKKDNNESDDDDDEPVRIVGYLPPPPPLPSSLTKRNELLKLSSPRRLQTPVSKASWIAGKQRSPVLFRALVYTNKWYASPILSQSNVRPPQHVSHDEGLAIHYKRMTSGNNNSCVVVTAPSIRHRRLVQWLARELNALSLLLMPSNGKMKLQRRRGPRTGAEIDRFLVELGSGGQQQLATDQKIVRIAADFVSNRLRRPQHIVRHFVHELSVFMSFAFLADLDDLAQYDSRVVYFHHHQDNKKDGVFKRQSLLLPVNLIKYRLHPETTTTSHHFIQHDNNSSDYEADNDDDSSVDRIDLARHFSAAGFSKSGYVNRILHDETSPRRHRSRLAKRRFEDSMDSDNDDDCSVRATLFSSSSSEDDEDDDDEPPPYIVLSENEDDDEPRRRDKQQQQTVPSAPPPSPNNNDENRLYKKMKS